MSGFSGLCVRFVKVCVCQVCVRSVCQVCHVCVSGLCVMCQVSVRSVCQVCHVCVSGQVCVRSVCQVCHVCVSGLCVSVSVPGLSCLCVRSVYQVCVMFVCQGLCQVCVSSLCQVSVKSKWIILEHGFHTLCSVVFQKKFRPGAPPPGPLAGGSAPWTPGLGRSAASRARSARPRCATAHRPGTNVLRTSHYPE